MSFQAQILFLASYAAMLLWWGSRGRPGFASWHMFARVDRVYLEIHLSGEHNAQVNPWDYLPHTYFAMTLADAQYFLYFLQDCHGLTVSGRLRVWDDSGNASYQVEENELVD